METSSEPTHIASPNNSGGGERQQEKTDNKRIFSIIRWLSIAVILAALLTMVRLLPIDQALAELNGWISGLGIWGPIVLALVYVVATVLFVPGTILTLAAGALFGLGVGTLTVSVGSTLGASLAFLIARYAARDKIAAMARGNGRFGAIDRAIGEGGWKIVALLRLSPAIPFNLQNYLYGLTRVRFWPYVLTSWLAMLPGTFLYVYIGHVTKAAVGSDRSRTPGEWVLLAVGLLATAVVTIYITRLARRKLKEQMDEPSEGDEPSAAEDDGSQRGERQGPRLRSTVTLAATASLMVATAVYVYANSGAIENRLARLFGPPRVELHEAYSEDPAGPTFDHSTFDELLHEHVDADGWVDYDELQPDDARLDEYLEAVVAAPFDAMGRNQKLALLINAYNAFTLKLILEHQPIDSIMDIPGAERWDAVRWNIGGHLWSLNQIEHEQIRPKFADPRVHFALVCAAIGCPPLRNEAYDAARIDQQLEDQTEYVHRHQTWFQVDAQAKAVRLTKLYNWYGSDFEQTNQSVLQFAARFSPELNQALENDAPPRIEWLPYDWKLNSAKNKQPR